MLDFINELYKKKYSLFLENEEQFYEYILYCAKVMSHYRKDFKKFSSYFEFLKDIIENKNKKYFDYIKKYLTTIDKEINFIDKNEIKILHYDNNNYPQRLKILKNPPRFIFFKGKLSIINRSIAMVGTRKIDNKSIVVTNYFSKNLVKNGFSIISGNAKGVDFTAQNIALKENGKVAIIAGMGLFDFLNRNKINNNILVLTEFPIFFSGNKISFPIRNRIISALSLATIMVQAPIKSGALYTADYTLEQDKFLFVPPGEIFNKSYEGNFKLLKQENNKIKLLTEINDILSIFQKNEDEKISTEKNFDTNSLNKEELNIFNIVKVNYPNSISFNKLFEESSLKDISIFQSNLLSLILKDYIFELAGQNYILKY